MHVPPVVLVALAVLLTVLLAILAAPARAASPVLVLEGPTPSGVVVQHVDHFVDDDWSMTVERALGEAADAFVPLREKSIDFGYTRSRIWLRVRLANGTADVDEWRLFFAENFKQVFDLHVVRQGPDGPSVKTVMSLRRDSPFSTRPIAYPELTAPLDLAPGEAATVLIALWSEGSSYIEFSVETRDSFDALASSRMARNFVFYGAMTLLIVIALAALAFLRRAMFLAYAGYAVSALIYVMHADGATFQYLWPNAPGFNSMASVYAGTGIVVFGAVFARLFLRTRELHPLTDRALLAVIVWTLGINAVLLWHDVQLLKKVLIFTSLVAIVTFTLAGVVAARVRFRQVRFYLLAWVGAVVSATMLNLNHVFGIAISQDVLYDSMRAVMVFDAAMMGLAIADGYNQLRQSRQAALENSLDQTRRNLDLNRRLSALEAQYHAMTDLARSRGGARLDTARIDAVHDLRTPLNALRVNVDNVLRGRTGDRMGSKADGAANDASEAEQIERTFDYLEALMRSMLDTGTGTPRVAPSGAVASGRDAITLDRVVRRVHEMFAGDAEAEGLDLALAIEGRPSPYPPVDASLDLLRVASNLVSNAVKYTSNHIGAGRIELSLGAEPGAWVVAVTDSGPGLTREAFDAALARGERLGAGAARESPEGHGLGLAIAAGLAGRHGWTLDLAPRGDDGTKLELRLPR